MDVYRQFVGRYEDALRQSLPAPDTNKAKTPLVVANAPVALLFSPHPDDEVITGALALRLQQEVGARVVNVAVTLGSNAARRDARRREVENACKILGWDLAVFGWESVTPEFAEHHPGGWQSWISAVARVIQQQKPKWIFYPHAQDWHPTHRGVNKLVEAALKHTGPAPAPVRILTEYWHPLANPNLLVECAPESLSKLVAALCCHEGEVARNPYHLTLPAWMADNVRRGGERVAGPGQPAPKFPFGVLYRVEPDLPAGWEAISPTSKRLWA